MPIVACSLLYTHKKNCEAVLWIEMLPSLDKVKHKQMCLLTIDFFCLLALQDLPKAYR